MSLRINTIFYDAKRRTFHITIPPRTIPENLKKNYISGMNKVATSDYLQRGIGYTDFMNCKNEIYRPEWLREILEIYLKKKRYVKLALLKRFIQISD